MQRKVKAAGIGGSITTLIVFVASQLGLDIPPEVAAALATLISVSFGYEASEV
jgi:putative flippase GtrA